MNARFIRKFQALINANTNDLPSKIKSTPNQITNTLTTNTKLEAVHRLM